MLLVSVVGFWSVRKLVSRWGSSSGHGSTSLTALSKSRRVESVGDLASLPVVLLVFTVLWFLSLPVINGVSRHYERQADRFGLEISAGIVPHPGLVEARALQSLGEINLADPAPNLFIVFWLYTHPPLDERIRSAVRGEGGSSFDLRSGR